MTVLLLGDLTGRSRVALRMLCAALEKKGHEVLMLPTALISNTLSLDDCAVLDTTDYLLSALAVWDGLGLRCDLAYIGYITGCAQARRLAAVADDLRARGVPVLVDPILGDDGRAYRSVTPDQIEGMRLLCRHADLMTPNLTEARLLTGAPQEADCAALARELAGGARSVLITSAAAPDGRDAVIGLDARTGGEICLPFARVPGRRFGTGDLFAALLMDGLLRGLPLCAAAREAGAHVGAQLRGEEESLLPE